MKLRIIELFENLKIKVYEDGTIETLDHKNIRKMVGLITEKER